MDNRNSALHRNLCGNSFNSSSNVDTSLTTTFILTPSKTFKQCLAQPCIYAVVKGSDRCVKHNEPFVKWLTKFVSQMTAVTIPEALAE